MKTLLQVTGIDRVALHVKNLARSKKFYVELLGMEVEQEKSGQLLLRCGSQTVALFQVRYGTGVRGGSEMNHIALRLKDGDHPKVKAMLEESGFKVAGHRDDPNALYLRDPDGHHLKLLPPGEK